MSRRARLPLLEICQLLRDQVPETKLYSLNALAEEIARIRGIWEFILGPEDEAEDEETRKAWEFINDLLAIREERGYALAIKILPPAVQMALKAEMPPPRATSFQKPRRIFREEEP